MNSQSRKEVTVSDAERVEHPSTGLTRGDLLKKAGAAAFAASMFGSLPDKALGVYGPLRYARQQLSG